YTAKRFWDFQSRIPAGGHPIGITLYADKTTLSSFGRKQGYPIMANIINFPEEIRNGHGLGSTQVVGWLPTVRFFLPDLSTEKSNSEFVDFKKTVWHALFKKLLENVAEFSKEGIDVRCGDRIVRRIYPFIARLEAQVQLKFLLLMGKKCSLASYLSRCAIEIN
ncbi:hypothetical protein FPV67DRAFT_1419844, partial [Lyophyllum atratum]